MEFATYSGDAGILIAPKSKKVIIGTLVLCTALTVGLGYLMYKAIAASALGLLVGVPLTAMAVYTGYLAWTASKWLPGESVTSGGVRCVRRRGMAGGVIAASDIAAVYRRTEHGYTGVEFLLRDGRNAQLQLSGRPVDNDMYDDVDDLVADVAKLLNCPVAAATDTPHTLDDLD